ncbi:hypothetical protein Mapa_000611 [Marchantia paleacea]|nr:hypothetical protein Mapa_000611 [Marchantia paleacea]
MAFRMVTELVASAILVDPESKRSSIRISCKHGSRNVFSLQESAKFILVPIKLESGKDNAYRLYFTYFAADITSVLQKCCETKFKSSLAQTVNLQIGYSEEGTAALVDLLKR